MNTGAHIFAVLLLDGKEAAIHDFLLPKYGEPRYHQQVRSYYWFRQRELKRFSANVDKPDGKPLPRYCRLFPAYDEQFKFEYAFYYSHLPHFTHANVWDFYKGVKYDYRRKRYLRDGEDYVDQD